MITQTFDLNLIPDQDPVIVHVDQYDTGTGRFIVNLFDGDVPYSVNGHAVIQGTKPDGKGFVYSATIDGNTVTANITDQMTPVAGDVRAQIVVTESTGRTGTFVFIMRVQPSALPDDTSLSESDLSLIEEGVEAAQRSIQAAESAEASAEAADDSAEDAEAWAVGQRDGTDVPSTDPTYQNNAKWYAEHSTGSAEEAEAWARGTRDGTPVPSTDETYHNNSKWYSEQSDGFSEDSEAWAVGKRDGVDVTTSDPTYHNNAKWHAEKSDEYSDKSEAYAVGKRDGRSVPSTDAAYHNNAKWYSEQASDSADSAAASDASAAQHENNAAASDASAEGHAIDSEAWAVGQRSGSDVPSQDVTYENNSKYYAGQSSASAQTAAALLENIRDAAQDAIDAIINALDADSPSFVVDLTDGHLYYDSTRFEFSVNNAGHLTWQIAV